MSCLVGPPHYFFLAPPLAPSCTSSTMPVTAVAAARYTSGNQRRRTAAQASGPCNKGTHRTRNTSVDGGTGFTRPRPLMEAGGGGRSGGKPAGGTRVWSLRCRPSGGEAGGEGVREFHISLDKQHTARPIFFRTKLLSFHGQTRPNQIENLVTPRIQNRNSPADSGRIGTLNL
jgi:hypothetical protein